MAGQHEERQVSRRTLIRWTAVAAAGVAGAALSACSSGTTATASTAATTGAATTTAGSASATTTAAVTSAAPATGSGQAAAAGGASQELTVADAFFSTGTNSGDLAEIDPARRGTWGFAGLLWAPLVAQDANTNPVPAKSLASSWDVSADGKVYTFHLRPEAKFSDGSPVTAQDGADDLGYYAMMYHKEAIGFRDNFGTLTKRLLFDVVGMLDAATNATYDQYGTLPVPGVKAVDAQTLEITLTAPSASFIQRIQPAIGVFRKTDLVAAKGKNLGQLDFWSAHAVNSGPYKLSAAVPGDHYEMVPNESYFGPKPKIPKITVKALGNDPNTLLTAFGGSQLDLVSIGLQGATVRQALANATLAKTLVNVPNWIVDQYWVTPNEPLDDEHARRAFRMAIDFPALLAILNAGSPQPLFSPVNMHRNPAVPSCQAETAKVTELPFNPAMAKQELAQSKYGTSAAGMEINLLSTSSTDLVGLQAVQKMLQDNLGMTNVKIHTEKVANLLQPPFPLHLWPNTQQPWYPDITDTLYEMASYMPAQPWTASQPRPNIAASYVPQLQQLVIQARDETDATKKCGLIAQAGQMWNDNVYSLDYAIPNTYYMVHPWVQGTKFYVNGVQGLPIDIENWTVAKH